MIEVNHIGKMFDTIVAVEDVSIKIREGTVFGMIGTNGAGKSTILRMITGILKQDRGEVLVDGREVYEDEVSKQAFYFIPEEPYFFPNSTGADMEGYISSIYTEFDKEEFYRYLHSFDLEKNRKISTFSKGMKKQMAILLGICSNTKYLICDETFDGLDPVMRQGIKSILAKKMEERNLTTIIASHNLRELEDICDHIGLLHKGGVLLSKDLEEMKCNIHKIQIVFKEKEEEQLTYVMQQFDIIKNEKRGSLYTLTIRGEQEKIEVEFKALQSLFYEILPLSLEEIFISETEVVGYDIKKLMLS
ncbi:MAG: ABC transporter ATP-binding protein [Lachnospiraceae bacterium]